MSSSGGSPGMRIYSVITTPLIVVSVVFPVLAAVSIHLRLVAKRRIRQPFHADDWWIIATWFLTIPMSILFWVFAAKPGVDDSDVFSLKSIYESVEVSYLAACIQPFPLASVKVSVLLFYKRIFSVSQRLRVCVWVAINIVAVWLIIFTVFSLTLVDPISKTWRGGRVRWDTMALGMAQGGSSVALDLVVLCFPLPIVFRMLLSTRKKFMVLFVFWLGSFCCVAAIVRIALQQKTLHPVDGLSQAQGMIDRQSTLFIFMLIEPYCSIIAACLPCYGPFMGKAHRRIAKSYPSSNRSASYTPSWASQKWSWAGSRHGDSYARNSEPHIRSHSPYGWPGESQYIVRCSGGDAAFKS